MENKFDRKFSDKIKEEFEKIKVPYNPGSWSRLEQLLISARRKKIIKYTFAAAATFGCMFLLIILLDIYPEFYDIKKADKNITSSTQESIRIYGKASDIRKERKSRTALAEVTVSASSILNSTPTTVIKNKKREKVVSRESGGNRVIKSIMGKRTISEDVSVTGSTSSHLAENRYIYTREDREKKKIRWGVVFSPQMPQAENDYDSELGFAGGVSSEFPLFSQFKLDVGVIVSRQLIGVDRELENNYRTEVYGSSQSKKVDVKLLALDIPINLKYDLIKNISSSIFISAGISSLAYISENYSNEYYAENLLAIDENAERTVTVFREEEKSVKAFKRFDAAKLLNFSVGMNYSFRNGMDVQIEPFIKYPLGRLTTENIKLGSGGIQFRIYF